MPKNPLTPRQTAMRLLEHIEEDATYSDIIRQMRILQDIDQTMSDADVVGSPSEKAVEKARTIAVGSWQSLADRSDDVLDSLLRRADWIH